MLRQMYPVGSKRRRRSKYKPHQGQKEQLRYAARYARFMTAESGDRLKWMRAGYTSNFVE